MHASLAADWASAAVGRFLSQRSAVCFARFEIVESELLLNHAAFYLGDFIQSRDVPRVNLFC